MSVWAVRLSPSRKKLKVLVAGCGSDQAAILSRCNPNHYFTGIDLSQQSINYQKNYKKNTILKI